MKRDLMNSVHPVPAIAPQVITDNTAAVSAIIDTQGFDSATFVTTLGTIADVDATAAVLVEHGAESDLSDAAAVPDEMLVGTEALAGFQFDDDNECRKIGYVGDERFVRMTVTPAGNSGNLPISSVCILGHAHHCPTPNPPA